MTDSITIGTRGSKLALWQANWVKQQIERYFPEIQIDLDIIRTQGDKILDVPLAKIGGKGLFVKEIEDRLLGGSIDLAVHSMKDMPGDLPSGLGIGAVPLRENPCDVLITRTRCLFADLPCGARIGTSSLRRAAQLMHLRPDLRIVSLRGNLETRLRKLDTEGLDAIVLAAAGIKRLGLDSRVTQYLDPHMMLPAAGQGALCIEVRDHDARLKSMVSRLNDPVTRQVVSAERAFLHTLEGGCQVPIAAFGQIETGQLRLWGLVAELDGQVVLKKCHVGRPQQAAQVGRELAHELIGMGADTILATLNMREDGEAT